MMKRAYFKHIFLVALAAVATGDVTSAQTGVEVPAAISANLAPPPLETPIASGQVPSFVYNRERPDPFFPFLTKEIMQAEAKAKAELPGLQKFEPAQLTLVAIVSGKKGLLAMVQDAAGIGYVLRKGTKIGETGKVIQISRDKVIIEQLKNVAGEMRSQKIEMTLSKEGEK